MVKANPVVDFQHGAYIESARCRGICRQLWARSDNAVQTDKVLVHGKVVIVDRDHGVRAVFIRQQNTDIAPLNRVKSQVVPKRGKPIQILSLLGNIEICARIVLLDRLAKFGCSNSALSIADNQKLEVRMAVVTSVFSVFGQEDRDVYGGSNDAGFYESRFSNNC